MFPSNPLPVVSRFGLAFLLLSASSVMMAADYQSITTTLNTTWESTLAARWNQEAPWDGSPPVGGPGANDNLDLAAPGIEGNGAPMLLDGNNPPYAINNLSASIFGQSIQGTANNEHHFLNIGGNLSVINSGTTLSLTRGGSLRPMFITVAGDVVVDEGATFSAGRVGTAISSSLDQLTVAGSTFLNGVFLNHSRNPSNIFLGDLVMGSEAEVTLVALGDTNSTSELGVRSLAGSGTVYGSNFMDVGTRSPTLVIDTQSSSAGTYGGTLVDSSVVSDGDNILNLRIEGEGSQTLTGTNTYSGSTTLSGGRLVIGGDGSINTTAGIVIEGGTLVQNSTVALTAPITWTEGGVEGSGTIVGNLTASGSGQKVLSPGNSPGTLTIDGDLSLDNLTTVIFELNGPDAGVSYDVLNVSGTLALNDATLEIILGFTPGITEQFTVALFDQLSGTFNGIGDGDTVSAGAYEFMVNYLTGSGEIMLTTTAIPEPGHLALLTAFLATAVVVVRRRKKRVGDAVVG